VTERAPLPPINFTALADALLGRVDQLLTNWLPGGVVKNGEYFVSSVWRHEKTPSLSVRVSGANAGCWRDHGGDAVGGDLLSLYAAIHGLTMGKAAVAVAREEGLEDVAGVTHANGDVAPRPIRVPPVAPPVVAKPRSDEGWRTVMPVPDFAPAATFWHQYRNSDDHKDPIDHLAVYKIDGALMGYVVRFITSEGKKETLPYTWCISAKDGGCKWHWKTWDEPRPLYFPGGKSPITAADADGVLPTVVVVEGEKKASILQALLDVSIPGVYVVASWAGGCKAWGKTEWNWLNGCTVLLWPDCDGHREVLTKKERDACLDNAARDIAQAMKPVLPADKQPGMRAMLGIGAMLRDAHACTVSMLPIPAPLEVVDGWDCADAINVDGWDGDRVLAFFGQSQPLPASSGDDAAKARSGKPVAPSGGGGAGDFGAPPANAAGQGDHDDGDDAFADHLMFMVDSLKLKGVHDLGVNRKLVIAALRKAPGLRDCLGFNELTGVPSTRRPLPWRNAAGPLEDMDDLALGDWVSTKYHLKAASRAALSEAMDTVADSRRFHPVRDWLNGLEHDGKPRLEKWLIHVLGLDPNDTKALSPKLKRYLELVGKYMLLGLVARVQKPGCKFDYSPVLEGPTGIGKSTFVKVLVGEEFFSDTHFDIGQGKDGMEQFCGVWAYELSELTALRRADSEQVKQFFSSQKDRFRGAYGRYVQDHPRQLVIFCSTNKKQYLYDTTGNRRFWPFWIKQAINLVWLRKWREQLFAEAMVMYQAGAQIYPSLEEEKAYFVPEQDKRLVETSVQSRLYELLTREGAASKEGAATLELNQHTAFVTIDKLVIALGTDPGKASTMLEGQIRGWLEAQGWEYGRESTGARRRGFKRPDVWPPEIEDEADADASTPDNAAGATEGDDDEPF
jgi:predicted P-loop ATPase